MSAQNFNTSPVARCLPGLRARAGAKEQAVYPLSHHFFESCTKFGVDNQDDKDYLSHYRIVEQITQVFGTTLLTLLPVLFARSSSAGFFLRLKKWLRFAFRNNNLP